jgi:hypothetical protein
LLPASAVAATGRSPGNVSNTDGVMVFTMQKEVTHEASIEDRNSDSGSSQKTYFIIKP